MNSAYNILVIISSLVVLAIYAAGITKETKRNIKELKKHQEAVKKHFQKEIIHKE